MPGELLHLIEKVQQRLREGRYQNESAVREAIVLPVLRALGWEADDPGSVRREYPIERSRVDYALFAGGDEPTLLIEVKAVGLASRGDEQLFEYLFHHGTPMAVLTDGQEWDFYLPTATGRSYDDRRVQKLDLLARDTKECVRILERYLDQVRVRSGDAFEDAGRDHKDNKGREKARKYLRSAWEQLANEPDELLAELLAEKTEEICGWKPEEQDVEKFLASLRIGAAPPANESNDGTHRPPDDRTVEILLDGKRERVPSAKAGLIRIIEHLAKRDPSFLPRLATVARGTKRQYVAERLEDMYPGHPDLQRHASQIANGWYLAAHGSIRKKQKIVKAACEVAGLRYGQDIALLIPE